MTPNIKSSWPLFRRSSFWQCWWTDGCAASSITRRGRGRRGGSNEAINWCIIRSAAVDVDGVNVMQRVQRQRRSKESQQRRRNVTSTSRTRPPPSVRIRRQFLFHQPKSFYAFVWAIKLIASVKIAPGQVSSHFLSGSLLWLCCCWGCSSHLLFVFVFGICPSSMHTSDTWYTPTCYT